MKSSPKLHLHNLKTKALLFVNSINDNYPVLLTYTCFADDESLYMSIDLLRCDIKLHGYGTRVMTLLCRFANENKVHLVLTPTNEYGSSLKRLINFYKKFNFKKNTDFRINYKYIRYHS